MGAHAQALLRALPAATTVLRRVGGYCRHHLLTSGYCFVGKAGAELLPTGISDALAEVSVPQQAGNPQRFQIERVVGSQQRKGRLEVEAAALPPDLLVRGEQTRRSPPPLAP